MKTSIDKPDWITTVARMGYSAKGVVYFVVGILAVGLAAGVGGSTEGSQGALEAISRQPFGRILLAFTALGLLSYVAWRFVQAAADTEDHDADFKGVVARTGYVISGIIYLSLAGLAGRIAVTGGGGSDSGDSRTQMTAELMSQPFGRWLVAGVGIVVVGIALYHGYRAYTANFMDGYRNSQLSARQEVWAKRIGQLGLSARGVTFLLIGWFFVQAALQADASEARGLEGALSALLSQSYGSAMLGVVAAGFVAYAVYCWSRAAYRKF